MPKVFRITPKRVKRTNGLVLTPEMSVVVTTRQYVFDPFYNSAEEVRETYMRIYGFDYRRANCSKADFSYEALDK